MKNNSLISIRNGAIASTLGGIILLMVPNIRNYILKLFSWVWTGIIWCWNALIDSYSMPGWVYLIVFFFALIGIVSIYLNFRGESDQPEFISYTKDHINGAYWRWNWVGNQIGNLWCYCPNCDATLVYLINDFFNLDPKTDFYCENCKETIATVRGGDRFYAIDAIKREVLRRIRTEEYKKH